MRNHCDRDIAAMACQCANPLTEDITSSYLKDTARKENWTKEQQVDSGTAGGDGRTNLHLPACPPDGRIFKRLLFACPFVVLKQGWDGVRNNKKKGGKRRTLTAFASSSPSRAFQCSQHVCVLWGVKREGEKGKKKDL